MRLLEIRCVGKGGGGGVPGGVEMFDEANGRGALRLTLCLSLGSVPVPGYAETRVL